MTLEAKVEETNSILKTIHTMLASALATGASTAAAEKPAASGKADKPAASGKAEKAEAKSETKTDAKDKALSWKDDVLPTLMAINKSDKPGHGREGIVSVMKQFGLDPAKDKVPALEALGKHVEVLAFAKGVLEGTGGAADDDLGL
jgi:hypothetical protein